MKLVGIKIFGETETHIPGVVADYITLCGLDGDDPQADQYPAPAGNFVTCETCKLIWGMARKISPKQLKEKP